MGDIFIKKYELRLYRSLIKIDGIIILIVSKNRVNQNNPHGFKH